MYVLQALVELSEGRGSFLRYGGCTAQSLPGTADLLLHLVLLRLQRTQAALRWNLLCMVV